MAAQSGLCQAWSENPKTGFLGSRLILCNINSRLRLKKQPYQLKRPLSREIIQPRLRMSALGIILLLSGVSIFSGVVTSSERKGNLSFSNRLGSSPKHFELILKAFIFIIFIVIFVLQFRAYSNISFF